MPETHSPHLYEISLAYVCKEWFTLGLKVIRGSATFVGPLTAPRAWAPLLPPAQGLQMLLEFPGRKEAIFIPVNCTSYIHPFIYPSNKHFLVPTMCFALLCDGTLADRKDMALKELTNQCYSLPTKAIRVQRAVGKIWFLERPSDAHWSLAASRHVRKVLIFPASGKGWADAVNW